jgi:DNA-binding GntR family transcriptional regulator
MTPGDPPGDDRMERIERSSMGDAALAGVRHAILTGEMRPGEPIQVRKLQERLGISHIPIREALRQLEAEGLVVAPPRRTATVAGVAIGDLSAIYEVRRLVEVPTARRAVAAAQAADRARVHEALARFEVVADQTGSVAYWERHEDFHWALLASGANAWTRRVLEPLWHGSERYVRLFREPSESVGHALRMHARLRDAFQAGEPDALADALTAHLADAERLVAAGYLAGSTESPADS